MRDGGSGSDGEDMYGSGRGRGASAVGKMSVEEAAASVTSAVVARFTPLESRLARLVKQGWRGYLFFHSFFFAVDFADQI